MINPEYLKALNDPNSWDPFAHAAAMYDAINTMPAPEVEVQLIKSGTGPTCDTEIFIYRNHGRQYIGRLTAKGEISCYLSYESLDLFNQLHDKILRGEVHPIDWQPKFK